MNTLFIIDDDKFILYPLKSWFQKKGYMVYTFENTSKLYQTLEKVTPNFILLDVNLPGEYGFDVCRYLKEYLNINTTIYLWSANSSIFEKLKAYQADGFIQKPVDFDALNMIIDSHMPNKSN